jgi:molybdopterin-synthase adenylyltransferase
MNYTEEQLERYSRHILLSEVGVEGQERIRAARILIIGLGGLGSPAALYLAAAGVGTIGLVDNDRVDLSNLQRQIVHFTQDVNVPKVESAAAKMRAINPDIKVETHQLFVKADNILDLIRGYDFVIDGTDSFVTKFLINDGCVLAGIPFSHGGILRFDGQTMTVLPGRSACYRCVFREPPPAGAAPTCAEAGVLGAIAGMLGTIQAAEALKYVIGVGEVLSDRLLTFDAKRMCFRTVKLNRQENCPLCGKEPVITRPVDMVQPVCAMRRGPAGVVT